MVLQIVIVVVGQSKSGHGFVAPRRIPTLSEIWLKQLDARVRRDIGRGGCDLTARAAG